MGTGNVRFGDSIRDQILLSPPKVKMICVLIHETMRFAQSICLPVLLAGFSVSSRPYKQAAQK
jgi:hypothetical protein